MILRFPTLTNDPKPGESRHIQELEDEIDYLRSALNAEKTQRLLSMPAEKPKPLWRFWG